MNCPYCGKPMRPGWIETRGERLSWTPHGEKKGGWRWSVSSHGIPLGKYSFFRGCRAAADYCSACRKIILSGIDL